MPPRETLATTSSWMNFEVIAARVVLAHPCAVFHLCLCGLHRGATTVTAVLVGYDDVKAVAETMIDYFLYTNARLCWITASTLLPLFNASVMIHNLLLISILE
jgi:hypothetical protein